MKPTVTEKTTASEQRGPYTKPGEIGISSAVRAQLPQLTDEIRRRIEEHVARKG